ncbi:metal ABC transporter permease [Alicyclobacillus dauci]|uniref:Metal ABC transporter permease n=1 Tax=Alicyclobacillus dauci TaxID=1475485 RepID=A0ABY6Z0C2_9BACL|nr:metal ABC transporter permease [Alicyclobacillus dauci]WAH35789.1 metal ABC transporter permease [Alicyclobacillus dauci]
MNQLWSAILAPGLFHSKEVGYALVIGLIVAALSGMIGVFVVIRGQSFVGHVLTDIGAAGGSGSFLIGLNAWYGFVSFGVLAGAGVELLGNRARNRDVATGIILSFAMGLGALFLYFDTNTGNNANASMLVLFGSIFVIHSSLLPIVASVGGATIIALLILYRPLLLCSISPEVARSRGIPVRFVSIAFMILLALAVENGSLVIGSLLSTALLIGPAATAIRITTKVGMASILSAVIGMLATSIGIVLAYDSYTWLPTHRGWPVSFFIAVLIFLFYLLSRLWPSTTTKTRKVEPREAL